MIVRLYSKLWTSLRTDLWIMDEGMVLFGANLMFVLGLLLFRQRVDLLFISKGEWFFQMGLGALS